MTHDRKTLFFFNLYDKCTLSLAVMFQITTYGIVVDYACRAKWVYLTKFCAASNILVFHLLV